MKALRIVLAVALLALSSSNAGATAGVEPTTVYQGAGPKQRIVRQGTLISATMAATRSFTIEQLQDRGAYGLLVLLVCVTDANNSVTALGMSCGASDDDNVTSYTLQDITVASGVGTSTDASWTKDPSGLTNKCWPWRVDIEGFEDVSCSITNTGGTAGDTLVVHGALATKG